MHSDGLTSGSCLIKVAWDPSFARWIVWLLGPSNVLLAAKETEDEAWAWAREYFYVD